MDLLKNYCVIACCLSFLSSCGQLLIEEEGCQDLYSCEELSSSENPLSIANSSSEMALSEISLSSVVDDLSSDALSSQMMSSSIEFSSSSRFVAVSSVMSSFNEVWDGGNYQYIEVEMLDEWGLVGDDQGAIVFPWSDVVEGGNSMVLNSNNENLGLCPQSELNCFENWNIASALDRYTIYTGYEGDDAYRDIGLISSYLQVTDYIPSSKSSWGWAEAGWWILPSYDKDFKGDSPFEKARPIGLQNNSWIHIALSYPENEGLMIQLTGLGIDKNDKNQSPPRFYYEGKGYGETLSIPVRVIKRAGWSTPGDYDYSLVTGVGLLRMEASMSEGAQFPQGISKKNKLQFACISFSESEYDGCHWSHGY